MSDINEFQVNHGSNEDERQEFMNAYKNYVVAVVKQKKSIRRADWIRQV